MNRLLIALGVSVAVIVALLVSQNLSNDGNKSLGDYTVAVANTRLAAAANALDGSGNFSEDDCNKLGELAKSFDPKADYIVCSSPDSIFLATPDTVNNYVLTLSDEKYTATFTTDTNITSLVDYTFSETPSGGFNKLGGRK
jgi:hypothetical protein